MGRPGASQTPRQSEHDGGEPALSAAKGSRSELGRQVAVDLETDADLHKDRSGPGHCWFPKGWLSARYECAVDTGASPARQPALTARRARVERGLIAERG